MFGMNKKEKGVVPKNKPKAVVKKHEVLSEVIKESDEALLITSIKGKIEVRALKNLTYAHEAKGLIAGALDTYLIRPINKALNTSYQTTSRNFGPILNTLYAVLHNIKKVAEKLGIEDEKSKATPKPTAGKIRQ